MREVAEELCVLVARIVAQGQAFASPRGSFALVSDFRIHSQLDRTVPAVLRNVRLGFWSCAARSLPSGDVVQLSMQRRLSPAARSVASFSPAWLSRPPISLFGSLVSARTLSSVLDAEKLTVYHVALELQCMANTLVPSVNRVLRDQFERASLSVILNLAEGCGRVARRQRRYHFGVARGSATECAALTDVLRLRRLTPASECFRARSLAVRCVQMLTKLVESMGPAEAKAESS